MSNEEIQMMPVQVERILAACIDYHKEIKIPVSVLLSDYTNKQIQIDQSDDDMLTFRLVDSHETF